MEEGWWLRSAGLGDEDEGEGTEWNILSCQNLDIVCSNKRRSALAEQLLRRAVRGRARRHTDMLLRYS